MVKKSHEVPVGCKLISKNHSSVLKRNRHFTISSEDKNDGEH